jgi:2-polyprenyl-3-methyl-5-hydroxy-6-metoxy-1,4-benzoquinol methylase
MSTESAAEKPSGGPGGPQTIMNMFQAAQATAVLCSAVELGVFAQLADGGKDAAALARRVRCPERSARILLDALVALGLLGKERGTFRLTPAAETHLVPGTPGYIGDFAGLIGSQTLWTGLGRLSEAIRAGGTVLPDHAETPKHPFWETFAKSSGSLAIPAATALEGLLHEWIAQKSRVRVLDIATGSGIYGFTLLRRNANVELTALDWPNVLAETRQWAERLGVDRARVRYLEGDLFETEYGGPFDLVLLSHVYHHFAPTTCRALTRKVAEAVVPGGRIAVHDFLAGDDNPGAAMFSVMMLAWTREGQAYSADDYRAWFREAGLKALGVHASAPLPTSFLFAEKV